MSTLNQVERKPNGELWGRSGNIDYQGRLAYIWDEKDVKGFKQVVKIAESLWIARL